MDLSDHIPLMFLLPLDSEPGERTVEATRPLVLHWRDHQNVALFHIAKPILAPFNTTPC